MSTSAAPVIVVGREDSEQIAYPMYTLENTGYGAQILRETLNSALSNSLSCNCLLGPPGLEPGTDGL